MATWSEEKIFRKLPPTCARPYLVSKYSQHSSNVECVSTPICLLCPHGISFPQDRFSDK